MSHVLFHQIKSDKSALMISVGMEAATEGDVDRLKVALNGQHGKGVIFKVAAWAQRGEPAPQTLIYENIDRQWTSMRLDDADRKRTGIYLGQGYAVATVD
jgi:hypothetical protein